MGRKLARLETVCRYFICLLMLVYGTVKLFRGQFYTDEYWRDMPLGQLSGFELAWAFHSHSAVYESVLGLVEVGVGLLVFFPRTTRLGILLFVPVMTNLVLINIFFAIGALPPAIALWLAGIILLFLHFRSLKRDLWDNSLDPRGRRARLLPQVIVIIVGCALAAVILYNNKLRFRPDPKIRGAWKFAAAKASLRRVYFEKGQTCVIKDEEGGLHFARYETRANRLLTVKGEESPIHWEQTPYHFENGLLVIAAEGDQQLLVRANQAAK